MLFFIHSNKGLGDVRLNPLYFSDEVQGEEN